MGQYDSGTMRTRCNQNPEQSGNELAWSDNRSIPSTRVLIQAGLMTGDQQ